MPTSQKQIEANRQNAKKSTGPKSKQGKSQSAQNSIKHGLYSKQILIQSPHYSEDPAEYEELYRTLEADLQPRTAFQELLLEKITNCLWRSRRIIQAESAEIRADLLKTERKVETRIDYMEHFVHIPNKKEIDAITLNCIHDSLIPSDRKSLNLLRYEMRMDRQLSRLFWLYQQSKSLTKLPKKAKQVIIPAPETETDLKNEIITIMGPA
ncbi:MAG: hypothetical protein R3F48_10115 [Candidatus Zixiibacteriota bacterium]